MEELYCRRTGGISPLILNVVELIVRLSVTWRRFSFWQISTDVSEKPAACIICSEDRIFGILRHVSDFLPKYAASFPRTPLQFYFDFYKLKYGVGVVGAKGGGRKVIINLGGGGLEQSVISALQSNMEDCPTRCSFSFVRKAEDQKMCKNQCWSGVPSAFTS